MNTMNKELAQFVEYVEDFYGAASTLYPMGATTKMIIAATEKYINKVGTDPEVSNSFCGDSLDREKVRDIMIDDYDLVWPFCSEQINS